MCGIVGILGTTPVAPLLLDALKRLEYRGYDSAGIATLEEGKLTRLRAAGKIKNLEERLTKTPLSGHSGIGHTRWATHGKPTKENAHPHATPRVSLVHNGIIENFRELKAELMGMGVRFESQTDTEVIAHLITHNLEEFGMSPENAVKKALKRLEGAFAIVVLFDGDDNLMIGARRGSPLAIGYGEKEMFFGSDEIALAHLAKRIAYLEDDDVAIVTREKVVIYDSQDKQVERPIKNIETNLLAEKGIHKHFMAKEMHEQPEVVGHTFARYLDLSQSSAAFPEDFAVDWKEIPEIMIVACGTSYYAGLTAQYWLDKIARIPTRVDVASEFRYRDTPLLPNTLVIVISQSGETADTLAALRLAKKEAWRVVAIVNVPSSTIAREANYSLPILAGPEIGVASTKAFTCQLALLFSLAIAAGKARGVLPEAEERRLVEMANVVPTLMSKALALGSKVEAIAKKLNGTEHAIFLGRGLSYPVALEGALKLKEIAYIDANGYAAGELKHGPIALIDKRMPVVVLAHHNPFVDKLISNTQEVAARDGKIVLFTDRVTRLAIGALEGLDEDLILILPDMPEEIAPLVYAIPVQLLAYYSALYRGKDVDQPRNLAKSVTVE